MRYLFVQADNAAPLIVPDSVQKANLAQTIEKVMNLDIREFITGLLGDLVWIGLKILLALAIYFIGRWFVRRIVRLLDAAFARRNVDISLRSFLHNTIRVLFTLVLLLVVVQTLGVNAWR